METVNIGIKTLIDINIDEINQIFKLLNIILVYNIVQFIDIPYENLFVPKANLGKGKNPSCGDRALSTLKRKMYQYLNGVRILNISSSLISDNFLLFILLEIFLHSDEHGSQVS